MSLKDKILGGMDSLTGGHDDYVKDEPLSPGEVEWKSDATGYNPEPVAVADAEASINYEHPDALPAIDTSEDAGLAAVRKLKAESV